jgi:alkylation response protein AidB-like acyl-CoA dehydrogenase
MTVLDERPVTGADPDLNFDDFPADVRRFRRVVREYAQDVVAPRAEELDAADAADFAWDVVQAGHDVGLTRAIIPKEFGGEGVGVLGTAVALDELASVSPGMALVFGATMLGQTPILLSGDAHLQSRFLPLFAGDQVALACNAVTEEDAGCDLVIPENAVHARNVTTAVQDGDHYVLNGRKRFITNAPIAAFATVWANVGPGPGASGLTCFVVPLDSPGVTRGPVADKMGYRACLGGELLLQDVRVPADHVIGNVGEGVALNVAQGNMARSSVAAISTGIARHGLRLAVQWCGERIQGGRQLREHQMTAQKLARMSVDVDAAELLYLRAAHRVDNELPAPEYEPAAAKLFADRVAIDVAGEAVALMGARGYVRSFGAERVLRDAYGTRIYEGTPQALALAITDCLYRDDDDF